MAEKITRNLLALEQKILAAEDEQSWAQFMKEWGNKKTRNPETGNTVKMKSLPEDQLKKKYEIWKKQRAYTKKQREKAEAAKGKKAPPKKEEPKPKPKGSYRQQISEARRRNQPPPEDSNWRELSEALDIGVLDLDGVADDLDYSDFDDLDISISPRSLADDRSRKKKFFDALRSNSMKAEGMTDEELEKAIRR